MNGVVNNDIYIRKKNKLNIVLYILIGILVILIGLICFFGFKKDGPKTRTFMIYMVGADLESKSKMGTYELNGIDPTKVDLENVNVVLIAGGAEKWNNNYIDVSETSIYQLTEDGFTKVKSQSIENMGSSETLSNFINDVTSHYITDEYDLLFWNHGGGLLGSEFDELQDNDYLSLKEMSEALSNTIFNKNNKLESVIFSTCLNGSIEMANVYKDYANYFVASEEVSISTKNTSDFSFINNVTTDTKSNEIGLMFINKYKEKIASLKEIYDYNNVEYNTYSTYSIVDLNNLDNLNNAVNNFFSKINLSSDYNTVAKVRNNLYQYGYNSSDEPAYDTVDLYNLVYNLKDLASSEANNLLNILDETILYNYATDPSSMGMSIYFPYNGENSYQSMFLNIYENVSNIDSYKEFINDFYNMKTSNSSNKLSFTTNKSMISSSDKEADFSLELDTNQVTNYASASYVVFRDKKDGTYYPVYLGNNVTLDNNTLKANIKDRQLKVVSKSEPDEENIITLIEQEEKDDYIKYTTHVVLENLSEFGSFSVDGAIMTLIYNKNTGNVSIGGVVLSNSDSPLNGTYVDLNDYTDIIFASSSYYITNDDETVSDDWESNRIYEGEELDIDDFEFKLEDYDDGYDYYAVFKISDVNNNKYYSRLVKMN